MPRDPIQPLEGSRVVEKIKSGKTVQAAPPDPTALARTGDRVIRLPQSVAAREQEASC
jgi:hypothetical protein